ncbi:MAG: MarR family transcriptional regulator [Parvularculaceae bacterium]
MKKPRNDGPAGLPGDPVMFKVLTEMSIISNLADREFERLMPGGLTLAQFGVLNHLLRLNEAQTIGEVASAMTVAQPTMSSTVRKLEEKGYIRLVPDTEDRRIRRVAVTAAGRKVRDGAVKTVAPGVAKLMAATPDDDWEAVLASLTRLREQIDSARS